MKGFSFLRISFETLIMGLMMSACSHDSYESGDGRDSYLRADFVEAHTASAHEISSAVTDEGDSLVLSPRLQVEWAKQANATYRGLLYYNKVVGKPTEAIRLVPVPVLSWHPITKFREVHTDPVVFESAWLSRNHRYVNIGFSVKTGVKTEGMKGHTLGLIATDSLVTDGKIRRLDLTLYHDQGGMPQYYSSRGFISVVLSRLPKGCIINLRVNSYKGRIYKSFNI